MSFEVAVSSGCDQASAEGAIRFYSYRTVNAPQIQWESATFSGA
ncbi:hypothetical protein ACQPW1_25140 [Nocardia sp. CA-128927]